MNTYQILKSIRDDLRDNIEDPIHREGQYIHIGDVEISGKTPSVFIDEIPGGIVHETVGDASVEQFMRIQITVVVKKQDTGRIDNEIVDNYKQLLNDIMDAVATRLASVATTINTTYIKAIHYDGRRPGGDIGNNRVGRILYYQVQSV